MNKERINEIIDHFKGNNDIREAFIMMDDIAKFLIEDDKFKTYAQSKAINGFVSPSEMILLANDYLNKTDKYTEFVNAKKTEETKAKKEKVEPKKISIFDLEL